MIRYVSKQGNNGNSGESLEDAYVTITYALSQMSSGGLLYVYPGTYTEVVTVINSLKLVAVSEHGEVVLDGTGNTSAVEIQGKHDVLVDGFIITNTGGAVVGWSIAGGIAIRDENNTPGVGKHPYNITIQNCTFRDILRQNDTPGEGALPLLINSYSDTRLGHTPAHDIQVLNCRFEAGKHNIVGSGLLVGQLVIGGNVTDVLVENCDFYWDETIYNEESTGIEFVAGYSPYTCYPDIPRQIVIRENTFEWVGSLVDAAYAVYVQGQDVLIENNTIIRWGLGVGVVCEEGTNPDLHTSKRVWIRNNTISNVTNYSVLVGAWGNNYLTVEDVWVTGNVINKDDAGVGEFPPISYVARNALDTPSGWTGSCRFVGNYVSTPESVFLLEKSWDNLTSQNVFLTDSAVPLRYPDYATEINWNWSFISSGDIIQPYAVKGETGYGGFPSWYVEGSFGNYSPEINPPPPQGRAPRPCRNKRRRCK
jgi:hypothetical protein